ncbi:MFS transporter [Aquabacterium sp.]|uniref:MFS transporter n=1 Tax=Aquabacterium sp. TaxID=1872578 RepID=UPI003783FD78
MLIDLSPLRRHRDFRLVFIGQLVSAFGSFLTFVALPVQLYELTHSSAIVGLLGVVQLLPLACTALWGGALADAMDRRRVLLGAEALLMLGSLALVTNASLAQPSAVLIFAVAALMSAVDGFHRPALESLTPRLVAAEDLAAVSALSSLRFTTASIAGPALAGLCIARFGMAFTFAIDLASYAISFAALSMIRGMPPAEQAPAVGLSSIAEGLRYAAARPELIGTYVVDIVAMSFAMPLAVFPALAAGWGGSTAAGYLYSAMSVGGLALTLFSGWTAKVHRRGAAVVIAAALWGAAIVALGFAPSLPVALLCLALAGAADMASGLFRMTIWNETIPGHLRGRMAGIEQLSYMSGPLLGNARAGFMAERFGIARSIAGGGMVCVIGVLACARWLPAFWRYRKPGTPAGSGKPTCAGPDPPA